MTDLTIEEQETLFFASPGLDKVQQALEESGLTELAATLVKIQSDTGISWEGSRIEADDPYLPETNRLLRAYEAPTKERLAIILGDCFNAVDDKSNKKFLQELMGNLGINKDAATQPPPPRRPDLTP